MQNINLILEIFQGFRMAPSPIDQYETVGRNILEERIKTFVSKGATIDFVMLGYPMKSPNNVHKVIGELPDLAEQVSIENFKRFASMVGSVYQPGVNIQIVSDGYVFNDLMGVEDRTVRAYEEVVVDMSKGAPIKFLKLMDFYDNKIPVSSMRNKVMDSFGISPEELERRILLDPDVNILYRGMIKFMTEDLANRNFPSKTQLQKEAKILARNMMFRNESYSKLVQTEFKDSIRLSMHPSINNGTKYSFQLIPSPKAFTSPWHCALLLDNENQYATIHRKDAEAAGYELIYKDGQPYYFQQN